MEQIFRNKILDRNNIDVVLYHGGGCTDGYGSAFIVWYYYQTIFGKDRCNQIKFIPCNYSKANHEPDDFLLSKLKNKNVLMCDFSFKYLTMQKIINLSNSFMIIDHHKTAEKELLSIPSYLKIFDMNFSACGLTWQWFFCQAPLPRFLAFIQSKDLWLSNIPFIEEFMTYFEIQPFDFNVWSTFLNERKINEAIIIGSDLLKYKNNITKKMVNMSKYTLQEINNQYYIVVYSNNSIFKSDIGSQIFDKFPIADFSCIWNYDLQNNQTHFSLRSTNDRTDVSTIAAAHGGGGHRNASGIVFSGLRESIPFPKIPDHGLIHILSNGTIDYFQTEHENKFMLFKVKSICREWFEEKYMNLIRRKCKDVNYIIFQIESTGKCHFICNDNSNSKDILEYINQNQPLPMKTEPLFR